jgi:GntR family transcriptional regulator
VRTFRYQEIATDLRRRITGGEFGAGRILPSEAELGTSYEASRVTVRRALDLLRAEGLVDSRQGFGWFVAADRVSQVLDGLATIEAQLDDSGRTSERQIVEFRFTDAPAHVAAVLGSRVLEVRRVNLADGHPFARVTVWCREDLGAELSHSDVERASFGDLLSVDLAGATQRIGAATVSDADAALLDVPAGSPVLVVSRTTTSTEGEPVLVSEHVSPGHLTEFVVDLRAGQGSETGERPALRLVDES